MSVTSPVDQTRQAPAELRTVERVPLRISVAYSKDHLPNLRRQISSYRFGRLVDISERGLCFEASDTFQAARILVLYLKLSDQSDGVRMLGKVVWIQDGEASGLSRVGIQFIGTLPPEWREIIR